MAPFFLLLGLALGLYALFLSGAVNLSIVLICLFLGGFLSFKKRNLPYFLVGLAIGAMVSSFSYIPLPNKSEFKGMIVLSKGNYCLFWSGFRLYYVKGYDLNLEIGDIVTIRGEIRQLSFTHYESSFDFGEYLKSWGVRGEIKAKSIYASFHSPLPMNALKNSFLSSFSSSTSSLLGKLIFQEGEEGLETLKQMKVLSAISSSGLTISYFSRFLQNRLNPTLGENRGRLITLVLICPSLLFAFNKASLWRVVFCLVIPLLDQKKRLNRLGILSLSGIATFLLNPHFLLQNGFLLSYGIAYLFYFSSSLTYKFKGVKKKAISLFLIYLFLLPTSIGNEGIWHPLSFFYGLILLPFSRLIYLFGLFSFFISPWPNLLNPLCDGFLSLSDKLGEYDLSIPLVPSLPLATFLFFLCFVLTLLFLELKMHRFASFFSLGYIFVYLLSLMPIGSFILSGVSFIDVGQGDAILIQGGGKTVMLDSGGISSFDLAETSLYPFLLKRRVRKIDAFIASHGDFDHIGALDSLKKKVEIRRVIEDASEFPLDIGPMHFENLNIYQGSDENESSLVITLKLIGKHFVFTGDAGVETEEKILKDHPKIDCDILKVGHHGSKSSTSESWLDALTPKVAVISCGVNNKYGHPNKEVLDRLESRGIKIRRTDLEGSISYISPFPLRV